MNRSVPVGAVRPLGDRAFLIGVADPQDGRALATGLAETTGWPLSSLEVVCGFATVMVVVRDPDVDAAEVEEMARRQAGRRLPASASPARGREIVVPCAFDGPDLDEVASSWLRL